MRFLVGTMMVVFGVAGIALVWDGLRTGFRILQALPRLVATKGVVLKVHKERNFLPTRSGTRREPGSSTANFPVIHFRTADGEQASFRGPFGTRGSRSSYRIGQAVPVLYDPDGDLAPMINSWSGIWLPPAIEILMGMVFVGGALLIWFAFGDQILGR